MNRSICAIVMLLLAALCAGGRAETFLVSSDLHLTVDRAAHESALNALRIAAEDVDGVILLGDNTNNSHAEEHAFVRSFLATLNRPTYVIPGNHDVTPDISDFIGMYADYGWNRAFSRDTDSASCAVMTDGGTCLLLMDTNDVSGHVEPLGGISEVTCAWVAKTLASLPENIPVIACGHHPILPDDRWRGTPGASELVKVLDGVRLYLCGHVHGFAAVNTEGLQQITVGQPHAYPGWAGILEVTEDGLNWRTLTLYEDAVMQSMRSDAAALAEGIARGTLAGTFHEGDAEAVQWFVRAFDAVMTSSLNAQACAEMLSAPGAMKWREIETKTVVKQWIFGLLENCPQDVRQIDIALIPADGA